MFDPVFAPEDVAFFTEHDYEPLTAEVSGPCPSHEPSQADATGDNSFAPER